jgi:glucose-6-phosphate isomerase
MKARQNLQSRYNTISKLHLRQLFKEDPGRGERMRAEAEGIFLEQARLTSTSGI